MLGIGNTGSAQTTQTHYYSINLTTGVATKIGDITSPVGFGFLLPGGLASDASGNVFLLDHLSDRVMEIIGLTATPLPSTIGFNSYGILGTTIDWSGNGDWYYGGIENLVPFQTQFRTINPSTGATTLVGTVGSTGYEFWGPQDIAIDSSIIPEPSTMLLLGSGLIGLAGFRRKFKKS